MQPIAWGEFEKVELRVGTILRAEDFPEARKLTYRLPLSISASTA